MFSCFATLPVGLNHPKMQRARLPGEARARGARQPDQLRRLHGRDGRVRRHLRPARDARLPAAPLPDRRRRARRRERAQGRVRLEGAPQLPQGLQARSAGTRCCTSARRSTAARATRCRSPTPPTRGSTSTSPSSTGRASTIPKLRFPVDGAEHRARRRGRGASRWPRSRRAFAERKDDIACIIIEPIQAEGGDNHFRPEFLRALRDLAARERGAAGLRRGADRHGHHRPHVGAPARRRPPRPARVRQEDAGVRHDGRRPHRRGAGQRVPGVEPHQLDLGRQPGRHGALPALPRDHGRGEAGRERAATTGAHLLRGLERLQAERPDVLSQRPRPRPDVRDRLPRRRDARRGARSRPTSSA